MKVGIASNGSIVSKHFGHCEGFIIYDIENREIKGQCYYDNPGRKQGLLPWFLKKLKIDTIISDGMGITAIKLFTQHNIKVILGAKGTCEDIIQAYIHGQLDLTKSECAILDYEVCCDVE